MRPSRIAVVVDLGFVAALLALAAVPLIVFRYSLLLEHPAFAASFAAVFLTACAAWAVVHRRLTPRTEPLADTPRRAWPRTAAVAALLLGVTLVSFALPLTKHFWSGYDEHANFAEGNARLWSRPWDLAGSRPLLGVPSFVGTRLTPDRIEGLLAVGAGLCFLNALLLYAILARVFPRHGSLAAAAAVLLVVNRADPTRLFVLWTANFYWSALFWLLLAVWLLVRSWERDAPWLLAGACAALAAALLTSEGVGPLALLGPVLLVLVHRDWRRLLVWAGAWLGTITLLAARFVQYLALKGSDAYQLRQSSGALRQPAVLLQNFGTQLRPALNYFDLPHGLRTYWVYGLLALALAAAMIWLRRTPAEAQPRLRGYLAGAALAALAVVLGVLPFLHLSWAVRTQFFAGVGQAVLLAFGLALLGRLVARRFADLVLAGGTAVLAASATAGALYSQDTTDATVCFEKTVHVFRQVHAVAPNLARDSLVLFLLDTPSPSPLGPNYALNFLAGDVLGCDAFQANYDDLLGERATFTADGVFIEGQKKSYRYEQVVAFRLSLDGSVALLRELPKTLVGEHPQAARYRPLARMRPGPVGELRYLRYPPWVKGPRDVLDEADGMVLGRGWDAVEDPHGTPFRWAATDAEVVVNPMGSARRVIRLEVEPGLEVGAGACTLEALDEAGQVVAAAEVVGRRQVGLEVPVDRERVNVFRLRMQGDDAAGSTPRPCAFRAFVRGGRLKPRNVPAWALPDVVGEGLAVGPNWYRVETDGRWRFRWVRNDAELRLGAGRRELMLDVEPGPGFGGQPCPLEVRDEAGGVVAAAVLRGREMVRVRLAEDLPDGAVLRLHVEGGDRTIPTDRRVLNFRVFGCH